MQSLVSTHDRVANKEYPIVHSATVDTSTMSLANSPIKIVRFEKQQEPLVHVTILIYNITLPPLSLSLTHTHCTYLIHTLCPVPSLLCIYMSCCVGV